MTNKIPPELREIFTQQPRDGKLTATDHNEANAKKIQDYVRRLGYPCEIREDETEKIWFIEVEV